MRTSPFAILPASILLVALFVPAIRAEEIRLGNDVVPISQSVDLKLDANRSDYTGSVKILLEVRQATDRFRLHAEGQKIHNLSLFGLGGPIEAAFDSESDDVLYVRTGSALAPGRYQLEILFSSPFGTKATGLYRVEKDGAAYAFTQFEANDAREAFPCWDEPRFKIPFRMTLSVPEGHVAVTNTPQVSETVTDGFRTLTFKETRPLPTYLLAIATGPLESVEMPGLGVPGRILTVQGQTHLTSLALQMTPPILKELEAYFGSPHPFEKVDFIAVPEFWPGAMENAGAITYADGILLLDETATPGQRRLLAIVVAHELAHQWFGNLVTLEWWDDLWLNEAFATWMGEKVAHKLFPELGLDLSAVRSAQSILNQDARVSTAPIRREVKSVDHLLQDMGVTYAKGSAVISMFERWMGPEAFRRGVNAYLKANAWGNATSTDLWRSLDEVSGKPVSAAMATFTEQPGFPTLAVEVLDGGKVRLTQRRFRNHGASLSDHVWRFPVTLKYPRDGATAMATVLLDSASATLGLDLPEGERPAWIYPNAGAAGYYRWTLESDGLQRVAALAGSVLSPAERIELVGNVGALLDAGKLGGGGFLDLIGSLADDPDPQVVRSILSELGAVKSAFVPATLEDAFAAYVRRTLTPALERIGLEKKPGEAEAAALVRPTLIRWLGEEGRDQKIRAQARAWMHSYLENPASIDPSLVNVAVSLAAAAGDQELFEDFRRRFETAETPAERQRFLAALGAFDDPEIRRKALDYALEGPLRPTEIFSISSSMGDTVEGRDLLFDWFTANYDKVVARVPPIYASSMPFVAGGCSASRLERGRRFFEQPGRALPGAARRLEKVAEQVESCLALRQREGEAVSRYLLSRTGG